MRSTQTRLAYQPPCPSPLLALPATYILPPFVCLCLSSLLTCAGSTACASRRAAASSTLRHMSTACTRPSRGVVSPNSLFTWTSARAWEHSQNGGVRGRTKLRRLMRCCPGKTRQVDKSHELPRRTPKRRNTFFATLNFSGARVPCLFPCSTSKGSSRSSARTRVPTARSPSLRGRSFTAAMRLQRRLHQRIPLAPCRPPPRRPPSFQTPYPRPHLTRAARGLWACGSRERLRLVFSTRQGL